LFRFWRLLLEQLSVEVLVEADPEERHKPQTLQTGIRGVTESTQSSGVILPAKD